VGRLDAGLARLEAVLSEHPSVDALRAIAQARARRDGAPAAIGWLRESLSRSPSLLGLEQLIELRQAGGETDAAASDIALAGALIQKQAARLSRFVCGQCGFKARRFYWQCPGCNHWDSYPPRRTEALEADGD
jgi:lipopolysaccharide biosynthesis regulator YciM